jgi:hypothetical protein
MVKMGAVSLKEKIISRRRSAYFKHLEGKHPRQPVWQK